MIIIGPPLGSGIGHHAFKYTKVFDDASYHYIGTELPKSEYGLLFLLPVKSHIEYANYAKTRVNKLSFMTVCETETVQVCSVNVYCPDSSLRMIFLSYMLTSHYPTNHSIHFIILET